MVFNMLCMPLYCKWRNRYLILIGRFVLICILLAFKLLRASNNEHLPNVQSCFIYLNMLFDRYAI